MKSLREMFGELPINYEGGNEASLEVTTEETPDGLYAILTMTHNSDECERSFSKEELGKFIEDLHKVYNTL